MVVDDVEGGDAFALGDEHADQLTERDRRHDDPALGAGQSGHRDLARQHTAALVLTADRVRVLAELADAVDPRDLAALGGDADLPLTDRYLGSDVLLVEAAAGHGVQRPTL